MKSLQITTVTVLRNTVSPVHSILINALEHVLFYFLNLEVSSHWLTIITSSSSVVFPMIWAFHPKEYKPAMGWIGCSEIWLLWFLSWGAGGHKSASQYVHVAVQYSRLMDHTQSRPCSGPDGSMLFQQHALYGMCAQMHKHIWTHKHMCARIHAHIFTTALHPCKHAG